MNRARFNFWMVVGNGAIVTFGSAFFAVETVLAWLVLQLTGSSACVGLLLSVNSIGWLWPQVFVGSYVEHRERKMPVYRVTAVIRASCLVIMALMLALWDGYNPWLLYGLLIALFAVYSSGGGICVVPFMDIVGKAIPRHQTPVLFAYRQLFGGILGCVAGGMVVVALSDQGGTYHLSEYAALIAVGAVFNIMAYTMFCVVKEPIEPVSRERVSVREFLSRGPVLFRADQDYRRFYFFRCCWALTTMSQVLYLPYAKEVFNAPSRMTGWFTAAITLVGGLSAAVWGRVSKNYSEVVLMRWIAVVMLLSPLTALGMTLLERLSGGTAFMAAHYVWVYVLMYGTASAATNGYSIAGSVYMLALAPPDRRPTYIAFMNTIGVPLMLAPVAAGSIVHYLTYPVMFGISVLAGLGALACACALRSRLSDPQHPRAAPALKDTTTAAQ
ncbi:MAG: MFS transporter [Candidatus Hydrogenedentes bacterium]|nr:MFS transporter [Candidatus Hydrogenedentota bacterium]